ncbi:hypothetical protein RBY4I_335 [Rhodobacterales bacterium Y4I]|nr:hypothetical protein RBY4I_335 [Rhodobacterales bacterium Y4I]
MICADFRAECGRAFQPCHAFLNNDVPAGHYDPRTLRTSLN